MCEQWIRFEFYLKAVRLIFQRPFVVIEVKVADQQYTLISKLSPNQKGYQTVNEKIVFDVLMIKNEKSQWTQQVLIIEFNCEENLFAQCSINLTSYIAQSTSQSVETLEIEPNLAIRYQISLQLLDENDSQKHMSDGHLKLLTETWQGSDNSYSKQHQMKNSNVKQKLLHPHPKPKHGIDTLSRQEPTSSRQIDGYVKDYKGLYSKKNFEEQKHQSSDQESSVVDNGQKQDPITQVINRLHKEPFLEVVQSTNMYAVMKELQRDKLDLKNQLIGLKDSNQVLQVKVDSLEIDLLDLKSLTQKIINIQEPPDLEKIFANQKTLSQNQDLPYNTEQTQKNSNQNQLMIAQLKNQLNSLMQELESTKMIQSREKELVKYIEDQKTLIQNLKNGQQFIKGQQSDVQKQNVNSKNKSIQTQMSGQNIDQMVELIKHHDQKDKVVQKQLDVSEKDIKDLFLHYQNSLDSFQSEKMQQQISPIKIQDSHNKSNSDQIEILEAQLEDYEHQLEAYKQENKQLRADFTMYKQDAEQRRKTEARERSALESEICVTKQKLGDALNLCFQSGHTELIDQINSALN